VVKKEIFSAASLYSNIGYPVSSEVAGCPAGQNPVIVDKDSLFKAMSGQY
jgi:hypothetical protein